MFSKSFWQEFRLLKVFYVWSFLEGLAGFLTAYTVLYFLSLNFSMSQVGLLISLSALGGLLFEIPTGAFADLFGRKYSVVLGVVSMAVICLIIPQVSSFILVAGVFFLYSAAATFTTGSDEAWIVDYLKQKKKEETLTKTLGRMRSFQSVGLVLALAISGAFVAFYPMAWLWYLQATVLFLLAAFLIFYGKERFKRKDSLDAKGIIFKNIETSVDAIGYSKNDGTLRTLMLIFLLMSVVGTITILWQPFAKGLGMPLSYIGLIYAIYSVVAIVLPNFIGPILGKLGGERKSLVAMSLVTFIVAILISQSPSWQVFVGLWCLVSVSDVLFAPVSVSFFQKNTPSKLRATIGSIRQMVAGIGGVIAPTIVGFIADAYGIRTAILFCSAFMIPIMILYWRLGDRQTSGRPRKKKVL